MRTFLTTCGLLLGMIGMATTTHAEVNVGDEMPAFELVGSDGKTYTSETYKGKKAYVIAWYPKAFTGGCTKECKSFRENGKALRAFDVAYFTASVDLAKKNADFAKSLGLDYPILSDPKKELSKKLGVLNARGLANRWTYVVGADGKILHIDKKVKAGNHGADVAKKLKELGVAAK